MRPHSFLTRRFGLILAFLVLGNCTFDSELRQFRHDIPRTIAGLEWPTLSPIGAFASTSPVEIIPDPRSLAQRAADLRIRARGLIGPVLDPARERAMRAALRRYYQG